MVGLLLDVFPWLPVSYLILKAHKHMGRRAHSLCLNQPRWAQDVGWPDVWLCTKQTPAGLPDAIWGWGVEPTRGLSLARTKQGEGRHPPVAGLTHPRIPSSSVPKPSAALAQPLSLLESNRVGTPQPYQLLLSSSTLGYPPFLCPGFLGPSAPRGGK